MFIRNNILEVLSSLTEKVNPDDVDLSSFQQHKKLNDKLWIDDELKGYIKKRLLKISYDFFETLEIPWVTIEGIMITGSLANYNYSQYSDIDLHIIIDFNEVNDNVELVKEYLDSKRKIWNDNRNIEIHDFDVELYVQDINEKHTSSGVYSLLNNEWLVKPELEHYNIDTNLVKNKSASIMTKIDELVEQYENGDYDSVLMNYEKLWDKIKKMRKAGLERDGEYSYENIVFKVLRRTGYIEKLVDLKSDSYDETLSIK